MAGDSDSGNIANQGQSKSSLLGRLKQWMRNFSYAYVFANEYNRVYHATGELLQKLEMDRQKDSANYPVYVLAGMIESLLKPSPTAPARLKQIYDIVAYIRSLDSSQLAEINRDLSIFSITADDGLDQRYIHYAIELVREICSRQETTKPWLYSVEEYAVSELSAQQTISKLMDIFENIIDVNRTNHLKPENINRIISQLVNIDKLSKSLDDATLANIKYHISLLQNEILNPEFIRSPGFSQEGEDLILKRLYAEDTTGFYVDVGAHHPTRFSNTHLLYKKGWRGINIDPHPGIMNLFETFRPNDINIECAVSDGNPEHSELNYVRFEETAYNSIYMEDENDISNSVDSRILSVTKVPARSLDSILEEHAKTFTNINLLSIDVEGFEDQVLAGFSIQKYKPDIIILEIRDFDIDNRSKYEVHNMLIDNGYKLRSVLFNSLIFESRTSSDAILRK